MVNTNSALSGAMPNTQIASAAHEAKADEHCTTKCAGSQGVHGRTLACHARRGGSLPPETAKHVAVDLFLNKWEDVIMMNTKGNKMKIVINASHGGFGLSDAALERYLELKDIDWEKETKKWSKMYYHAGFLGSETHFIDDKDIHRADVNLVKVVEELGDKANSRNSILKIVEIPDDVKWLINEYDGLESVHEEHKVWF